MMNRPTLAVPVATAANRPLRVAHVTATFPPYYGGTGAICSANAHGLAARGHHIAVFTAADARVPPGRDHSGNVEVIRLPAALRVGNAPLLGRLFGNALHDFDLVHLHYPFYFGGEAVYWQALRGVPYVVTYHQDVRLRGALDTVARLHHIMLGRRVLNGARLILATSLDYAVHSRLAHLPAAVRRRIVEMPNGVDTSRFTPREKVAARTEIGLPGGWISLFVGSLDSAHYFKGVAVLLQAFARFQATAVGAKPHLVIVGDGDLRPSYQALADQIGIADCVVFAGRVTDAQLSGYYAAADAVVLPSTTAGEAFGVVLLEAFASARPVIASALPGVRSVVDEGRDGFLVPSGDVVALAARLEHMAAEPGQGDAMGRAGRAKVERQYSWDVLLPQLEAYYMQALRNIERPLRARSQEGWTQ